MSLPCLAQPWIFRFAVAVFLSIAASGSASAQSWGFSDGAAGLSVDGALTGLTVGCAGAGLSLGFSGFSTRLQAGAPYTVVVTIDGIARRYRTIAFAGGAGSVLRATVVGGEANWIIEALRKGRKAVVATPAGRYDVPLSGSAKALEQLRAACSLAG